MTTSHPATWAAGVGCLLLATAPSAEAALPPAYQRLRELTAVLEAAAPGLADPIEAVREVGPGRFEVEAGRCRLEVRIVPAPAKIERGAIPAPGPLPFAAIPEKAVCR